MTLTLLAALALSWPAAGTPAVPASPDPARAAREMARARFEAGRDALAGHRWAEAEATFVEAIRLQPTLAVAHYGLGQALMAQSRYPEAADAFLSCRNVFSIARGTDPGRAREMEIHDLRDTLAALAGRHALTADRFLEMQLEKRLAELDRPGATFTPWSPPGVTMALGSAYYQAGALPEAEKEFLAVLRALPGYGDAENDLALVYLAMGRLEEAEAAMQRAAAAGVPASPRFTEELRRRRRPSPPPSP